MKFYYSSKHYLIGFILFLFVTLFGLYEIRGTLLDMPIIFIGFGLFCYGMLSGYMKSYVAYKDRYIYIYKEGIIFGDRKSVIGLQHHEIEVVIEAEHQHKIKLHKIIHVFLKDGRYFYFTTDIANYKQFKEVLRATYGDCYYKRKHLFPEGVDVTIQNLKNEDI
jgi:hypothetical protein